MTLAWTSVRAVTVVRSSMILDIQRSGLIRLAVRLPMKDERKWSPLWLPGFGIWATGWVVLPGAQQLILGGAWLSTWFYSDAFTFKNNLFRATHIILTSHVWWWLNFPFKMNVSKRVNWLKKNIKQHSKNLEAYLNDLFGKPWHFFIHRLVNYFGLSLQQTQKWRMFVTL